jgi:hypothetical protein
MINQRIDKEIDAIEFRVVVMILIYCNSEGSNELFLCWHEAAMAFFVMSL